MKIINHIEEDVNPIFLDADEKWLDDRQEPIVRIGGEPFESHYESEFHIETYIADPRRSFVKPLCQMSDKWVDGAWWVADSLACFLLDFGFNLSNPTKAMSVAFWTMFPEGSRAIFLCRGEELLVSIDAIVKCRVSSTIHSSIAIRTLRRRGCCKSWEMQVALMQSILQTLMKMLRRSPVKSRFSTIFTKTRPR